GVASPVGVPEAFLGPASAALEGLLARYARTHGPFLTPHPARRGGLPARSAPPPPPGPWARPVGAVESGLERLLENGTILRGEFRPGGAEREWLDPERVGALPRRPPARPPLPAGPGDRPPPP